jgi:hypothetical protein
MSVSRISDSAVAVAARDLLATEFSREFITPFRALCADDRFLVAEAAVLLVFLRVGLWKLSFATTRRVLNCCLSQNQARAGLRGHATVGRIASAVTGVARRLPARPTCLVEALAVEAMLRRRGFAPTLRVGVREPGSGSMPLDAHAWVECAGSVVIGRLANLADYAVFPVPKAE